jgi:hypothetical protein
MGNNVNRKEEKSQFNKKWLRKVELIYELDEKIRGNLKIKILYTFVVNGG